MAYTTIDNPLDYFNIVLYTGNTNAQSITGVGFQPDWVWIKKRSSLANHHLYDSVRGVQKRINSNTTNTEATATTNLTAFGSDGFTIGTDNDINENNETYASWNWKAGTSFTNDASSTGIGTIDSTGSASDTAGFSIVSYTGTGSAGTVKHGLSSAPSIVLIKNRSASGKSWIMAHKSIGFGNALFLNLTDGSTSEGSAFNSTAPTSSVFTVGNTSLVNDSGDNYIAYCFADIQGYSKVSGSYIGTGNADGPFIYTGFKPAFVLCKNTGNGGAQWLMVDNKRVGINPIQHYVQSNASTAEGSDTANYDFLSNGFKCRSTNSWNNQSGYNIIYMAFAENPFVTSGGVPATAR